MLLQDKKGLSIMIGYVLLVVIAIVMSMIVYQFVRTYVPKDAFQCPEGISVFVQEAKYDCDADTLEVTIKNNGRFNVAGYFIHATTSEDQELATKDLSGKISSGGETYRNSIVFALGKKNLMSPNDVKKTTFDLSGVGTIYKIEIIPVRFQEEEGKTRFVSCGDAKVGEVLSCWEEPVACEPDCIGRECGLDPVCGESCPPDDCVGEYGEGYVCNIDGQCIVCTPDCSCASTTCVGETCLELVCNTYCEGTLEPDACGTRVCGPAPNGCGGSEYCGPCGVNEECTPLGQCELLCGNGIRDSGEECDDGNIDGGDGCSSTCTIEAGWECDETEPNNICEVDIEYTCTNYCQDLGYGSGTCTSNTGQCTSIPGELMGQGPDVFCEIETYWCCCFNIS